MTIPDRYQTILDERLPSQFSESEKIKDLLWALSQRVLDTDTILDAIENNLLNVESGGVWLDLVGAFVGIDRPFKDFDQSQIFTIRDSDWVNDPNKGIYNSIGGTGGYIQSKYGIKDPTNAMMPDSQYRELIKAKIAANNVPGGIADIYNFILNGFGVAPTVTIPELNKIDVAFNASAGLISDYDFSSGIGNWVDNSTAPSFIAHNAGVPGLDLDQTAGSPVIADLHLTVVDGLNYVVFIDPHSTTATMVARGGKTIGATDYFDESIGTSNSTHVFDFEADGTDFYLRLTTNPSTVTFARTINAVQVIPLVTQTQRYIIEQIAPNVATTRLAVTDWPAI